MAITPGSAISTRITPDIPASPPAKPRPATPDAILEIDLGAIAGNYRQLAALAQPAECAAVVKADAYGLGLEPVVAVLWRAGCRFFFTAQLGEAVRLRAVLPKAEIAVLNGIAASDMALCRAERLLPVLNSLRDIAAFSAADRPPALVHIDTGMRRLGLDPAETEALIADPDLIGNIDCRALMTHLACANRPDHPLNAEQLERFGAVPRAFPALPTSIANSPGLFLGAAYHGTLVRPGAALFGIDTSPRQPAPMRPVVRLRARVLQIRTVSAGETIGYGADFVAPDAMRVATVAIGYADGYRRTLGNGAVAFFDGRRLPVVGRISMDLTALDVSAVPESALAPGAYVDLLNDQVTAGDLARAAGTIGYEVLTGLGKRFDRFYVDDQSYAPVKAPS